VLCKSKALSLNPNPTKKKKKKAENRPTLWPCCTTPGHISKEVQINIQEGYSCTFLFIALFTIAKWWNQSRCPTLMNG
jgi:hypothetical protein